MNAFEGTVRDNLKLYTKREIEGADAALEIFKRLDYPSQNSLVRMIRGGVLTNCGVTEKNVERAVLICGKPIGAIKDKHTHNHYTCQYTCFDETWLSVVH